MPMHAENGRTPPPPSLCGFLTASLCFGTAKIFPLLRIDLEMLAESISFQRIGLQAIGSWWKVFCGNYSFWL